MKWHNVNLPDYFTKLLKLNLQDHERAYRAIRATIENDEILASFISINFGSGNLGQILQSVGWHGFREQLAAFFISRINNGVFTGKVDRSAVNDLVMFEDRYKGHCTSGYSRAFLFAFYQKIAFGEDALRYYTDELYSLLDYSKARITKIDWTLALLAHFDEYLGRKALESILSDGIEFEDIFNFLKADQKTEMLDNLLAYGQSIDEPTIFMNDTI